MRRAILIAAALVLAFVALTFTSRKESKEPTYQGWMEAELIFVSPDENGRIEQESVREGDRVEAGAPLFTLDSDLQNADLQMQEASLKNAQQAYDRAQALLKTAAGTQKALEDAEAALRTAQARLNSSQTRLSRRKMASPVSGTVEQVYFRPGEMVLGGKPVVALLPPGNLKVRFFVSEAVLPQIKIGETVTISCDGCAPDLGARVSFIARQSEYTPPVIYSLDERSKLVFLIEARPARPDALRVGQPVSVALNEPPR
jgi:HlyD family secretion protein